MAEQSTTMMAVLLVVGLVIGAGVGYFMAPWGYEAAESEVREAIEQELTKEVIVHKPTWVSWLALAFGIASLAYDFVQEARFQKWRATVNDKLRRIR